MGGKVLFTFEDGTTRFTAGSIHDLLDVAVLRGKLQKKAKKKIVAWKWKHRP